MLLRNVPQSPAQGPAQTAGSGGLLFSDKIQLQGPQPPVPFEDRQGKESHILIFTLNLVGILTHLPQPLVCLRDPQPDWKDVRLMPCENVTGSFANVTLSIGFQGKEASKSGGPV